MNESDFEELFRLFQSPVYGFACHLTRNQGEAEDLFQETWLRVVRSFSGEIDRERFKAWLFTVVANLHKDNLRKKRIRQLFLRERSRASGPGHSFPHYILGQGSGTKGCPTENADMGKALSQAVENLPERQRCVFVLKEMEGFRYAEISEICSMPVGTVKSLLHRAVRRLRRELSAYNPKRGRMPCDAKTLNV
jgi:RNA polymerase sigma-70 factor (ECF subfamily)